VSLANYGTNCTDGEQTVTIALSEFKDIISGELLDIQKPLTGSVHARFWHSHAFEVTILKLVLVNNPTEVPVLATPTAVPTGDFMTSNHALIEPTPTLQRPKPTPTVGVIDFESLLAEDSMEGLVGVKYEVESELVERVGFFVDGNLINVESYEPYYLGGDTLGTPLGYDLSQLEEGSHELMVEVEGLDGSVQREKRNFKGSKKHSLSPTPTVYSLTPTTTPLPGITPTPLVTTAPVVRDVVRTWELQSVDAMKDTKDAICNQRPDDWIKAWVGAAKELGATHVAISMPYDNPSCGDAEAYTQRWIGAIRAGGLKVWHRQMPMAFEGIYSVTKQTSGDAFIGMIQDYIGANADHYQAGDIFTPIPEPQNGGIRGITYCAQGVCQFTSKEHFNSWIREVTTEARQAFATIGLADMKVGYYGFDGFVAWGANNPDWEGILEDETIRLMGNITIDHYPEAIGSTMEQGLTELEARYPGVPIVIGEWGTITGGDVEQQVKDAMGAAARHNVVGFNYWHFGPGGTGEQLIDDGFVKRSQFDEVQAVYTR
jgi:hypothetical protein